MIETQNGTTDLLSGCTIAAASLLEVTSNATLKLSGGTIGVGAVVETLTGGTASVAGTVHNSGTLFASGSNSVVLITSGAVVTGGVAEVGNGTVFVVASSSENVAFLANGSGGLVLNGLGNAYAGRVSGFGFGSSAHSDHAQFIDFDSVNFTGATVSYTSANPSNTSGTLTVTNGGNSASVLLVGNYSLANFSSTNLGHIRITDPGAAPQGANIGLLINYMAASFASSGVHGGAVVTEAPQTAGAAVGASPHVMTRDPWRGFRQSSVETFDQRQIFVTSWIALDAADHVEAELPVKAWRLKTMSLEHDLPAISRSRFRFDGAHQPRALALFAQAFGNEKIADVAGAAPHPAVETSCARPVAPAQEDADETPVGYAGRLDVEINEAVFEEADVLEAWLGLHDQAAVGRRVVGMISGHVRQYTARCRWSRVPARDRGSAQCAHVAVASPACISRARPSGVASGGAHPSPSKAVGSATSEPESRR